MPERILNMDTVLTHLSLNNYYMAYVMIKLLSKKNFKRNICLFFKWYNKRKSILSGLSQIGCFCSFNNAHNRLYEVISNLTLYRRLCVESIKDTLNPVVSLRYPLFFNSF